MTETKRALITGISGQDGSYLAELLLSKGYEVYGMVRRHSSPALSRIENIIDDITIIYGDMADSMSLDFVVSTSKPHEIYNLAAQSFVGLSWTQPIHTSDITGLGAVRLLESARRYAPESRIYQASSSEMFGKVTETPQNEKTPFYPRSPYGIAKLYAYWACINYRESHGMHISNGILFNHESPRRGIEFVTKKISDGVAKIYHARESELRLGNTYAMRDWGFAGDFVKAMWLMLQQDDPDDYVIATGETHSVQEFVDKSFDVVGLNASDYVVVDKQFMRPADVDILHGNYSKAKEILGWEPSVTFDKLIEMMVNFDISSIGSTVK